MDSRQLKQNLVNAILLLEHTGIIDFNGHFSVRIPGTAHILINSSASVRNALTVDDIITIDLNGNVVEGSDTPPNEYHIHTEIYKRREDVNSVVHAHPKWSTFFSMTNTPLQPVIIQGALLGEIQTFPQVNSINTKQLGAQLSEALGSHRAVLMKSHGAVVASEGILETFVLAVYMEENAYRAYMAAALGQPYILNEQETGAAVKNLWKPNLLQKVWNYHFSRVNKT